MRQVNKTKSPETKEVQYAVNEHQELQKVNMTRTSMIWLAAQV